MREGIRIAEELIDVAMDLFHGIYLITPFLRYEMTETLVRYIKMKQKQREGANV
jgi:homocysteine S-methyltransferase